MPRPHSSRFRAALSWGLAWLAATVATLWLFARPVATPMDEDELYWIGSAYYFHLAVSRGDWANADWALLPARENPPVAKYVLGAGLAAAGQRVVSIDILGAFYLWFENIPGAWGEGRERAKREAVVQRTNPEWRRLLRSGARPRLDDALLVPARWVVAGCAVLASLLLFAMGWRWQGPIAGLVASQLLLLNPAVVYAYNHAHADAIALLFVVAAAGAVHHFARRATAEPAPTPPAQYGAAAALGVLLGLACGAKMNALVVVGLAGLVLPVAAVVAGRRDRARGWQTARAAAVVLPIAFLVFVLSNPAIVSDFRAGLIATVREHQLTEVVQAAFLPGHLVTLSEKAAAVAHHTVASGWSLGLLTLPALGALAVKRPGLRFAATWYLLGLLCVTVWIPFSRGRYVLPVVAPAALLVGMGVGAVVEATIARLGRRAPAGLAKQ